MMLPAFRKSLSANYSSVCSCVLLHDSSGVINFCEKISKKTPDEVRKMRFVSLCESVILMAQIDGNAELY